MQFRSIFVLGSSLVYLGLFGAPQGARADDGGLLNVSYDVTREFYRDFNAAFTRHWQKTTGKTVVINQSHGGSSKQARSVLDGLQADVITMNQASDIDILHERGLVPANWAQRLPNQSSPTTSTTVFLVRKGNPRKVRDWDDLIKPGVAVIVPNPKTSGNGRYGYLAAYGYALKRDKKPVQARKFVAALFANVPVLDSGGRAATTTFVQRGIGDVLLTFESEVEQIRAELGGAEFEVVYPSASILVENPVSVVDAVVDKKGTRALAEAYLKHLYSEEGQELAAKHHFRPRLPAVAARHAKHFKQLSLFTIDQLFGGWDRVQKEHFADGSTYDQISSALKR